MFERTSAVDGQHLRDRLRDAAAEQPGTAASSTRPTAAPTAASAPPPAASAAAARSTNALTQGFAVISSDAGHTGAQNPTFGIDPQARLDYGYQAVAKLTPMAKAVIRPPTARAPTARTSAAARTAAATRWSPPRATPTSTTASSSATPASACRWRRSPTSPATRPTLTPRQRPGRPRRPASPPAERAAGLERRARPSATRSTAPPTAWCRTPTPARPRSTSTATCRPAPARATAPACQRGAEDRHRQALLRRDDEHRHQDLLSLPVRHGLATDGWATWKFTAPPTLDSGAVGLHLAGAAGAIRRPSTARPSR